MTTLATLAACGSTPEVVDDTPLVRTAVVTWTIANNGFKGYFANDGVHTLKTTAEMQRIDDELKHTGSITGRVSKGQDRSEIIRLDKNLEWQKEYVVDWVHIIKDGDDKLIEGYPVSRKVEWSSKNETCTAPPEAEADDGDTLNTKSIGGLLSSIGKTIVKQEVQKKEEAKRREFAMAPVFSITEEVTSIAIDDLRESQMSVPARYKLQTRR